MTAALLKFSMRQPLVMLVIAIGLVGYGVYSAQHLPLDAIPNVGDNQVIVLTEWPGRSPKDIEDQITYPLSIALQAVPGSQSVRGKSMFGFSFVQVTFDDHLDFYWARSRVAEQLTTISASLPPDVAPRLAPDATALGQIFYYVLKAPPDMDLAELRSTQDFFIRYALQSVDGVAEVASIGGYVKQYQIDIDPSRLRFHNLSLARVMEAVRAANLDVGAKTVETGGMEFVVRGVGSIGSGRREAETIEQIESTVVSNREGVPVRIGDLGVVQVGPAFRRGALDRGGSEAVGGVVTMRYGENPRAVIARVKEKIESLRPELGGVEIVGIYDRTELIEETVGTLTRALSEEILITIVVVVLFLLHVRASLVIAVTLPMAVLMAVIAMKVFCIDANIMSLAGIAIAIGTMVDMGIIVSENIYASVAQWDAAGRPGGDSRRDRVIMRAATDVVPAVITAVSTTIVSFLPVFFLIGRDGRLFTPLAWTKTFALAASLIVAVTFVPMLCRLLLRSGKPGKLSVVAGCLGGALIAAGLAAFVWLQPMQDWLGLPDPAIVCLAALAGGLVGWRLLAERLRPLEANPISRFVQMLYAARLRTALEHKTLMLVFPLILLILGLGAWKGLPHVFRPLESVARLCGAELNEVPGYVDAKHTFKGLKSDDWIALDEGSWFYMPSLYPAASFNQAMEILQLQDALIATIPEVADVLGKIGRVDSALDPAPAAMVETYVMLKPRDQWREGVTSKDIWDEINRLATLPGVTPASPLQPIEGRVVMLQSGIKASMAIRIYGDDLEGLAQAAIAVAKELKQEPLVDDRTVAPDIVMGKPYYEFEVNRDRAARYGMTTQMINNIVAAGLGGVDVTKTVEGRRRYPIQVRYDRSVRESIDQLGRAPVVTHAGQVVTLDQLAGVRATLGPGAINSEDARLVAHVAFAPSGAKGDLETVDGVMARLRQSRSSGTLKFPKGNFELQAVGSFENQLISNQRLFWLGPLMGIKEPENHQSLADRTAWFVNRVPLGLVPLAVVINLALLYFSFRDLSIALIVLTGIPVAFAGGMIAVAVMGVEMNTAIWIGFIALFGLAVDDGVVMATYIQQTLRGRRVESVQQLRAAIYEAGLKRIRPCVMTTVTTLAALVPILVSDGRGADVARAMALPVFGGMLVEPFTSFIVPTLLCGWKELKLRAGLK